MMNLQKQAKNVDFKHPDFHSNVDVWEFINNICDSKGVSKYLVTLNPSDTSQENKTRNEQFKRRAIFYAVAGYTSRGLVGKAFAKPPVIDIPEALSAIKENCDGAGTTLEQQAQDVTRDVTRIGRSGLLVDFPESQGDLSKAEMKAGGIFATIQKFDAHQIINWKTEKHGARIMLSKVVLAFEVPIEGEDGFSFENVPIRLELKIEQGVYMMVEWRRSVDTPKTDEWVVVSEVIPTDARGQTLTEIPFVFIGSESNTAKVDHAPMRDISEINKGHYNNSAIYEDSVFTVGQSQPYMSGITQSHIDLMKKNNMYVGSNWMLGVPSGETFGFAQAEPNTLAKEAMTDKVQTMVGLGAMFITPGTANKTATQSAGELMAQHSILSLIVSNVSDAYEKALNWVQLFMGVDSGEISFSINQDFVQPNADANMIREVSASFLAGLLPIEDLMKWQQRHGLVNPEKTLEQYSEEINPAEAVDLD